jgi:class 3 adenylate cyclase/tetratricopeptide (TPR) repeat protein
MRCTKCGKESTTSRKFCACCGSALIRNCPNCAAENSPSSAFCEDCGSPLTSGESPKDSGSSQSASVAQEIRVKHEGLDPSLTLEGERKTVTALFADIKGSTELMEDLDPEEARAMIDPALKLMIDAARRYDGYVVQSTGDGIFALFGAPVAHEDHPQRALYAALRMQEELERYSAKVVADGSSPIQGRVGVNTGEVVVRLIQTGAGQTEYTPIGHTTNLASRMQTAAPVGSIAVSENTRKLCEGYFILKPLGATKAKGVTEPVNVYEVTGLGLLRTRLQRAVRRGLTKFVGRERELEALRRAADQARAGRGQIVAAMAEAGVGKSRLFYEFKAISQTDWMVLETFSVSHGKASACLPMIDLLRNYFKIASEHDERARREKVTGRVVALDRSLEDTLPYLFSLFGIAEGADPLAQMDGRIKKRRTLEAIKRIMLFESLNQPLMVIFEDLHWIDEQTQELLNLLADSIAITKILLLVNYRPEYSHQWNCKTYFIQLRLDPLGNESADEMLSALLGDGKDLNALKRLIIERTGANPFFMEEIVQALFEDGALQRNGSVKLAKSMNAVKVPTTVQGVLAVRIDRLPPNEKELLQTLAAIGREFPLSLVRQVVGGGNANDLERMLADLQMAEFIYEQPASGDIEYVFRHALTQEVAYNSLLIERRKLLHERIGNALESIFANQLDDHLDELAHHYGRSANPDKAAEHLTRAGQQALTRSAFAEAQAQLQQGLDWIKKLPESPERDARELELASTLAQVLFVTRGWAEPETLGAAERASELAERSGNLAQLVVQVFGVCLNVLASGDYSTARLLADRILDLARREGSPASFGFACNAQVQASFLSGDLAGAEEHFGRLSGFLDADGFRQVPGAAVMAIAVTSLCACALGHADLARERVAQAMVFARDSNNPYELGATQMFKSFVSCLLREPQSAEVAAMQALALSEEHSFPIVRDLTRPMLGWSQAQLDRAGEGVALIRQGLDGLAEAGARTAITAYLTWLAEAQVLDGKLDQAIITIEEALAANTEELFYRPNALTCRGELRLKLGQTELAESDFRDAIALAKRCRRRLGNCARPPASRACSRRKAVATRLARCSPRSTIGSPRASTLPTWWTRKYSLTNWANNQNFGGSTCAV